MKTVVIYDSRYGNTKQVAETIAEAFPNKSKAIPVGTISSSKFEPPDLLVIGSPTQGGMPTATLQAFIKQLDKQSFEGTHFATFDTRFEPADHGLGLRILMNVIQFASGKMAKALKAKGGTEIIKPEGFIVEDKEGPLKKGELQRARKWAETIKAQVQATL